MQDAEILAVLSSHPLFRGLTEEQILKIIPLLQRFQFKNGDNIITEGEMSSELYLLFEGTVKLTKKIEENKQVEIGELQPYTMFGDISFIDKTMPRTLTVTAMEPVTAYKLKRDDLTNAGIEYAIIDQLSSNITHMNFDRLDKANQSYVKSLLQAIKELELREQFGHFFVWIVGIVSISDIVYVLVQAKKVPSSSDIFTWTYLMVALIPILLLIKKYHYPLRDFGVTLKGWRKVTINAILWSVGLSVLLIGGVILYRYATNRPQVFSYTFLAWITLLYLPHSYIQEFIARGVAQTLLERFFADKTGIRAVIITALVFGDIHFYISWLLAVGTFLVSLLLGFIYRQERNLIGVSIIHAVLGTVIVYIGVAPH